MTRKALVETRLARSGCAPAPVHEELYEDDEDADQHAHPQQDEAPAEQGEAVGLPVLLLGLRSLGVVRSRPVSVSEIFRLFRSRPSQSVSQIWSYQWRP